MNEATNAEALADLMNRNYEVSISYSEVGSGYIAEIKSLKGCMAWGRTVTEAYESVQAVKRAWLEIGLEQGWDIPEEE